MNFLIKGDILWQTRKKSHGQNLGLLFKNTEVLLLNLSWNKKKKTRHNYVNRLHVQEFLLRCDQMQQYLFCWNILFLVVHAILEWQVNEYYKC